jgi:hypothetical protein
MTRQKSKPRANKKATKVSALPFKCMPSLINNNFTQVNKPPSQYGGQNFALPGEEYLTLMVQRWSGEWVYVRVNQHCLDVLTTPCVFTTAQTDDLLEIWKRVVIDNAIPWEDSIRPDTLRIVRYKLEVEDHTLSLFGDNDSIKECLRMTAMSKLTDSEARVLNLTTLKAKQMIMHDPQFCREDKIVLDRLMKASASLVTTPNA